LWSEIILSWSSVQKLSNDEHLWLHSEHSRCFNFILAAIFFQNSALLISQNMIN
jgi:hypothetical protein